MTVPGDSGPVPRPVPLVEIRDAVRELVDVYESTDGVSPTDDYDAVARVHPMAEGKYLLACGELLAADVMSLPTFQRHARGSLRRLSATDVGGEPGVSAWGLGFSFRDLPTSEPFTITTAIVVEALARSRPHLAEPDAAECDSLVSSGLRWLVKVVPRVREDGVPFPAYSPGLAVAANNVAAYWSGVVATLVPERRAEAREVAQAVLDRYVPDIGWAYDGASSRVDLVHTGYIGHGLLTALPERARELAPILLTSLLQFGGSPWADRFDVRPLGEALADSAWNLATVARVVADHMMVGFDVPARSWSMGEAMVLLGDLVGVLDSPEFCRAQLRGLAARVLTDYLPESRYRHSMHLAHGLAAVVREARKATTA